MLKEKWKNSMAILIVFFAVQKYYSAFFDIQGFAKITMVASLILATILIIDNRKNYNLIHVGFLFLTGIGFVLSRNITLLYTYYLCLGIYAADFKKVVRGFILINAVFFAIYLSLNLFGVYPTEYIDGRNDFGFGNPNTAFINMFLIWSAYFYVVYGKKTKVDYIVLFTLIFLMYTQTDTRTGLLAAIATLIAYFILKHTDTAKKWPSLLIGSFPIFMTLLSLIIAVFLSDNYFINKVLSHRPIYWHSYVMNPSHGINLFGYAPNIRDILFTQRMPLDSGYIWTLYSQGIVVYAALMLMYSYTMYRLCKERKKDQILLMTGMLVYCFAESVMVDIATNIGIVLIVYGVSGISLKRKKKKKRLISDR